MSRSGYSDDCDGWALIRWRGAVASAIRGQRGQAALKEIAQALDAMPEKWLASGSLQTADGEFCTLGALGRQRSLDMTSIDADDRQCVAKAFGIAEALAAEIMFLNDEHVDDARCVNVEVFGPLRPWEPRMRVRQLRDPIAGERRWRFMRNWVSKQIRPMDKEAA
jgi:hypothetical protein